MKTLLRILATLVLSALYLAANATNKTKDTSDFVINGLILKTKKDANAKCKLELFHENKLVEFSEIKMNKPFERKLKKNVWYTLRITKEGYMPLLISFNTELSDTATVRDNLFEFETALIDVKTAQCMNKDQMDFPVGHVAYNQHTQKFEAKEVYTANYMANLYNNKPADASGNVLANAVAYEKIADIAKENITKKNMAEGMC